MRILDLYVPAHVNMEGERLVRNRIPAEAVGEAWNVSAAAREEWEGSAAQEWADDDAIMEDLHEAMACEQRH